MHLIQATFLVICVLGSLANAGTLDERAPKCTKDACNSVVVKNHRKHASQGCMAFLRKTVTPATVTSTTTSTTYAEVLLTVTTTTTSLSTVQPSTTSTATITSTATKVETSDVTTTTTTTLPATLPPGTAKKRAAARNKPVTNSQTTVPAYATSACHNTVAYSSACLCNSYTAKGTLTVATPTATKTVTSSGLVKLISTSTETMTSTTTGTDTTTILSTKTDMETITSTTTSTTTVTATDGPFYYLQIKIITQGKPLDPTLNNKFVYGSRVDNEDDSTVVRSGGPETRIRINPEDNTLSIGNQTSRYYFSTADSSGGQVLSRTRAEIANDGSSVLDCNLDDSTNDLACVDPTNPRQAATLQYCQCTVTLNDFHITYDGSVGDECLAVNLLASPAS